MNAYRLAAIAALSAIVASCGNSNTAPDATGAGSSSASMADAPVGAQAMKVGKGAGTVTAIDAADGKITLDHGPIPELGWPAMKMAFNAAPAVTGSAAAGDEVEFEVRVSGMNSEVTAITKK